jgi:hypothetical protein
MKSLAILQFLIGSWDFCNFREPYFESIIGAIERLRFIVGVQTVVEILLDGN